MRDVMELNSGDPFVSPADSLQAREVELKNISVQQSWYRRGQRHMAGVRTRRWMLDASSADIVKGSRSIDAGLTRHTGTIPRLTTNGNSSITYGRPCVPKVVWGEAANYRPLTDQRLWDLILLLQIVASRCKISSMSSRRAGILFCTTSQTIS